MVRRSSSESGWQNRSERLLSGINAVGMGSWGKRDCHWLQAWPRPSRHLPPIPLLRLSSCLPLTQTSTLIANRPTLWVGSH